MLPKHLRVDRYWTQTDAWRPCRDEVRTARLRERREAFRIEDANAGSTPIAASEDCSHEGRRTYCGGA